MYYDYRTVEGYKDYVISNYGEVYSLKFGKVRELKCSYNNDGYKQVCLFKDGIANSFSIHVLVGNAFIGKRTGEMTFDHFPDRNRINNRSDNIRLATRSEQRINRNFYGNSTGEKNISIFIDKGNGNEYYQIQIKRNKKYVFRKMLSKKKFSLEDAVKIRDDFLLKL